MQSDPCAAQPRARFHSAVGAVVNSPRGRHSPAQLVMDTGVGPFDFVFIDADKIHTPDYFTWALDRTRPGGLIVADNVVRDGALADPGSDEPTIPAQRRLHELIAADPRVTGTTIQTVGGKGYDGFTPALVTASSQ